MARAAALPAALATLAFLVAGCSGDEAGSEGGGGTAAADADGAGEEAEATAPEGPGFGEPITANVGVEVTFDDPSVGSDGDRRWLDVRITAENTFLAPSEVDFALICVGNNRAGQFLLDVDTPSPAFPLADPPMVPADSVTEGYVSLGLPQDDAGRPVEACANNPVAIQVLSWDLADPLILPEDLAAELVPERD